MTKLSKNYQYFRRHFDQLAKRHGGEVVVISNGMLIGTCKQSNHRRVVQLVAKARLDHPGDIPFVGPVPTQRQLATSLLI